MSKESTEKTISFLWQGAGVTKEVLAELCRTFLENPPKHGLKSYGSMLKSGKLESIEITENNIGSFLDTARKFDIDYALKRDSTTAPPTYHVFFTTGNSENFRKAFAEYASSMKSKLNDKSVSDIINREQIKQNAKSIADKASERTPEKHLSKSAISGR